MKKLTVGDINMTSPGKLTILLNEKNQRIEGQAKEIKKLKRINVGLQELIGGLSIENNNLWAENEPLKHLLKEQGYREGVIQ